MRTFLNTRVTSVSLKPKHVMATVPAVLMLASVNAHAALPDGIKTALEGGFSDAKEAAGLVIVGLAAIFGIMLIRRIFR